MKILYKDIQEIEIDLENSENFTLLDISKINQIKHMHLCNGRARCSTCRIKVLEGTENLSPPSKMEKELLDKLKFTNDIRLACQLIPKSDLTIERLLIQKNEDIVLESYEKNHFLAKELDLTIFFCDLRNFTSFSEKNLPYDVVYSLNYFFEKVCAPILENHGRIDKYMGDGILAVFGEENSNPENDCKNAIRSGLRILKRLNVLNQYLKKSFHFEFQVGIGIHHGKCVIGEIGHSTNRQLTVIGDTVNTASRIESMTKKVKASILISESVYTKVKDEISINRIFKSKLKGKEGEYFLYDVKDFKKPDAYYLVQYSFDKLGTRLDLFVESFYKNFFDAAPELEKLFIRNDRETQRVMLRNILIHAVKGLDNPEELIPLLKDLGKRHIEYDVKENQYIFVIEALLKTLKEYLLEDFTPEVESAWKEILEFITEIMLLGYVNSP